MTAQITTDKGGGPQVGSMRLTGAEVDAVTSVTFANFDNTGINGWKWEIIDAPAQSPTLNPIPAAVFTPTTAITHDVKGHSILVRLTTYVDVARTIIDDIDQVVLDARFDPPFDWVIPAAGQSLEVDDIRGWASDVNRILREVHAYIAGGGGGADADAIHDNVAGEIAAIASKSPLVAGDFLIIEDSADANNKKSATVADLRITESQITDLSHTDADAIHDNVGNEIASLSQVGVTASDHLLIEDADDSNNKKRIAASDFVLSSLYDAQSVLAAIVDNTPIAISMGGGSATLLVRDAGGNIRAQAVGPQRIPYTNNLDVWGAFTAVDNSIVARLGSADFDGAAVLVNQYLRRGAGDLGLQTVGDSEFLGRPAGGSLGVITEAQAKAILGGAGATDFVTQAELQTVVNGLDWQDSVLDKDLVTSPVHSPGARYIVAGLGGGWSGASINDIAESDGVSWTFTTPNEGFCCTVEDENIAYIFNGASWVLLANYTGAVQTSLFDANTILKADVDDTPAALTVPEQTLVGRITGGVITALTPGQIRTLINVADGATAGDADAIHDNVSGEIAAITSKAQAVAGDWFVGEDSADANNKKAFTLSAIMDSILTAGGSVLVDGSGNVLTA